MSNGIDKIVKERDCAQSALLAAQRQINEQSHQLGELRKIAAQVVKHRGHLAGEIALDKLAASLPSPPLMKTEKLSRYARPAIPAAIENYNAARSLNLTTRFGSLEQARGQRFELSESRPAMPTPRKQVSGK